MGKIIVVEDNLVYSRYVCNFLEENGYRTVSTSDCTGARKLFSMLEDDDIVLAGCLTVTASCCLKNCAARGSTIPTSS